MRLWRLILLSTAILALCAGCARPYAWRGTSYEPAQPAGEITGTDWNGSEFRLSDQRGKVALLFFGYTNCPDVCPTTLAEMRVLAQNLGDRAQDVGFIYVSVDPERDTPARLAEYIPVFNPDFHGVHVEPAPLEDVKAAYGVIAEKRPYDEGESAAGYSVDHTARTYLIDRNGRLRASFAYGTLIEDIQADIEHLLREPAAE
jgi:protein SCO1/2